MKISREMYAHDYPIGHPSIPVRKVARALEIEASFHRKSGNSEASWALREAAIALRRLMEGKTFAQAFDWPSLAQPEAAKGEK